MRKIGLVFALALLLGVGPAFALTSEDGTKLSGPHYQFNIIGHPKNVECISGDDSNGRAIMVPLKNVGGSTNLVCDPGPGGAQTVFVDEILPNYVTTQPAGAKIYFQCGETFEIIDRDACDNNGGRVQVQCTTELDPLNPTETQNLIAYKVYTRVLGKPKTCMNIAGYAYDLEQNAWFNSGTVYLNRSKGKSTFVDVSDIFTVNFCADVTNGCATEVELSVFNDVFESYFWNILNDGTRLVQVRLYPVTQ